MDGGDADNTPSLLVLPACRRMIRAQKRATTSAVKICRHCVKRHSVNATRGFGHRPGIADQHVNVQRPGSWIRCSMACAPSGNWVRGQDEWSPPAQSPSNCAAFSPSPARRVHRNARYQYQNRVCANNTQQCFANSRNLMPLQLVTLVISPDESWPRA